jgi:hypothetical protein
MEHSIIHVSSEFNKTISPLTTHILRRTADTGHSIIESTHDHPLGLVFPEFTADGRPGRYWSIG